MMRPPSRPSTQVRTSALALTLLCVGSMSFAQEAPRGLCGTADVDIAITRDNIAAAEAFAKTPGVSAARGAITYVPVRFKVVGNSDGTGEASARKIVDLVEAINRDFAPYNWRFFLEDVDGRPFDNYFSDDYNGGLSDDARWVERVRSRGAISMYVVDNASTGGTSVGVTLGYYSPSQDILVLQTGEVGNNAETATHELGHYFSLPHTFRGWDFVSWDGGVCSDTAYSSPVTELRAPASFRTGRPLVELVTRGDGANCAEAGDLFCDTGADYNLGLGARGCDYRGPVVDRNGDVLRPNEENFMSYFQDCASYEFSVQQFETMSADLRSARRDFLRSGRPPINVDSVRARAVVTSPANNAVTEFGDVATISWEPVEHALYYYVEVNEARTLGDRTAVTQTIVGDGQTSLTVDGLEPGRRYYVRVSGFNQLTVGLPSARIQFNTGTVSAADVPQAVAGLSVAPNPAFPGAEVYATFSTDDAGDYDLDIVDAVGRTVSRETARLSPGSTRLPLDGAAGLTSGTYFLRVRSDRGVTTRRFVIR